ncbi:MAG: hypothetical protein KDK04_21935 [Candidatus Competibacteraceae bacterium]|nr:hypothetical protein [Candidatus Competibacteraceae bacterium]
MAGKARQGMARQGMAKTTMDKNDTTVPDCLALIVPSQRFLRWLRATLEQSRQRGREPPFDYWRYLERMERLAPHTEAIASTMTAGDWHIVEKLLFVATSGDVEKVNQVKKGMTNGTGRNFNGTGKGDRGKPKKNQNAGQEN